jgi:hypothetical protein
LCGLPTNFHLNLDGQKLVFGLVKWVLVGLVAFYTFESFSFFSSKRFKLLCGLPTNFHLNLDGQKTCVWFYEMGFGLVWFGLVAFYAFDSFQFKKQSFIPKSGDTPR